MALRRLYLSPAYLTMTSDGLTAITKAVDLYSPIAHSQKIALNQDGTLAMPWGFCVIEVANHLPLLADSELAVLPEFPLDGRVSALTPGAVNVLKSGMGRFSIATSLVDNATGWREVVRGLGRLLDPDFNENDFL